MTKKHIVFVDDEPAVLSGLRRMLRPMRHDWEMTFADSGAEALTALERVTADIVVSDMRMPGMDGYELLSTIKSRHPDTVRFILSGQSEFETVVKSSGVAHQYISKPCDADQIQSAIDRALALRGRLDNAEVRRVVSETGDLPVLPQVYTALTNELKGHEPSMSVIGSLVAEDPALATKVLRLVNSSYFGLRTSVSSLDQAVTMLGLSAVSSLVLGLSVFAQWQDAGRAGVSMQGLWNRSIATATTADRIATSEGQPTPARNDAYLAGLLHAVGRLLLACHLPRDWEEVRHQVLEGTPEQEAEREVFGATHVDVGAYILELWGLPPDVVEAVAFQGDPGSSGSTTFTPLTAVHVALAATDERTAERLDGGYLGNLGAEPRVDDWLAMAVEEQDE